MNLFMQLLRDEHGFVLSAESMLLGTVGVIGATVGLSAVAKSVNDELTDVAMAIRSVDQSFHIEGASNCGACVAGSSFTQQPVKESLKQLREEIEEAKSHEQKRLDKEKDNESKDKMEKKGHQPPASKEERSNDKGQKKNKKPRERDEDHEDDDDRHEKGDKNESEKHETSV